MKILIIDDEPLVRRSLMRALISRGHQVIESVDGIQGLEVWTKEQPELAFVDVLMPGLTGPQVIQNLDPKIREKTKIILMSAYTGGDQASPKLIENADLFLLKPFDDIFRVVEVAEGLMKENSGKIN